MKILVTGGTGFIGSHTCVELLQHGHRVTIVDNLSNSDVSVLERTREITGRAVDFHQIDLLDSEALDTLFSVSGFEAVIHFAGVKAVGESVADPLKYYTNNVQGTLTLLRMMKKHRVNHLVFSSSATVYSPDNDMPLCEDSSLGPTNPYGRTKYMIEEICRDLCSGDKDMKIVILRYFNPVGAHPSGLLGESPIGIPNNLFPYITQTAKGDRDYLRVFGNDYDTPDGTGVRDYIHVIDLAMGHIKALEADLGSGIHVFNLGNGNGYSVLEIIAAFEKATGKRVPYRIIDRRLGDVPVCYSNPERALSILKWKASRELQQMCCDAWNYEKHVTNGRIK